MRESGDRQGNLRDRHGDYRKERNESRGHFDRGRSPAASLNRSDSSPSGDGTRDRDKTKDREGITRHRSRSRSKERGTPHTVFPSSGSHLDRSSLQAGSDDPNRSHPSPQGHGHEGRPTLEDLPADVLENILRLLDCRTLCTARLVNRTLCAGASPNISSLCLPSIHHSPSLQNFCFLSTMTVHDDGVQEAFPWLEPRCRSVITTISVKKFGEAVRTQVPLMRKLHTLVVLEDMVQNENDLLACASLVALSLQACTSKVADAVVTMTRLTSLRIGKVVTQGFRARSQARHSWLLHATQLTKLHALSAPVPVDRLGDVGNLAGLTRLLIEAEWTKEDEEKVPLAISQLSRLTRLRDLTLPRMSEGNVGIACSLGACRLSRLVLSARKDSSAVTCWSPLANQTGLVDLGVSGPQLRGLPHIRALDVGALRSLALYSIEVLDAAGLDALCWASSLTALEVGFLVPSSRMLVSKALGRLTQLRSLGLTSSHPQLVEKMIYGNIALKPLKQLQSLKISCGPLGDQDLQALAFLPRLRQLELKGWRLTGGTAFH